jgi:hypothetical protein
MAPEISRIDRWKHEMDDAEKQEFVRVAGDLLKSLGYEIN